MAGVTVGELAADRQRRDALLWNFTVLGEASTQLPPDFEERFPDVPWDQPSRLRNRIVHGYWSIDLDILHTTAQVPGPRDVVHLECAQAARVAAAVGAALHDALSFDQWATPSG
ncbi:MAG: HepT-like ribonuclease domain-containing protein [Frankiaceae bacterium]